MPFICSIGFHRWRRLAVDLYRVPGKANVQEWFEIFECERCGEKRGRFNGFPAYSGSQREKPRPRGPKSRAPLRPIPPEILNAKPLASLTRYP